MRIKTTHDIGRVVGAESSSRMSAIIIVAPFIGFTSTAWLNGRKSEGSARSLVRKENGIVGANNDVNIHLRRNTHLLGRQKQGCQGGIQLEQRASLWQGSRLSLVRGLERICLNWKRFWKEETNWKMWIKVHCYYLRFQSINRFNPVGLTINCNV